MSDLPVGWVEKPLAEIATLNMGQSPDSATYNEKSDGLLFLQGCGDFGSKYPQGKTYCSVPGKVAGEGDVLISVRAPVGDMNSADQRYCIGRGLAAISGIEVESFYLRYLIEQNVTWLKQRGQGSTFEAIGSTDLKEFIIPFPIELKERQKIANILSTVDNLIEKTQTLIDKYTAIKQGMMADLFTRGIDITSGDTTNSKGGKLRPSVEDAPELYKQTELGWVPKEWKVEKLENVTKKIIDGTHYTPTYTESGVPFLRVTDVKEKAINLDKIKFVSEEEHEILIKRCDPEIGDILYSKNGTIGRTKIVDWEWGFSVFVSLCLIKPDHNRIYNRYLEIILNSEVAWSQIRFRAKQGTVTNLHLEEIREFCIPIPSRDEQEAILNRVYSLNNLMEIEKESLEKLNRQKKGLMQDLLTGRVKVNG